MGLEVDLVNNLCAHFGLPPQNRSYIFSIYIFCYLKTEWCLLFFESIIFWYQKIKLVYVEFVTCMYKLSLNNPTKSAFRIIKFNLETGIHDRGFISWLLVYIFNCFDLMNYNREANSYSVHAATSLHDQYSSSTSTVK